MALVFVTGSTTGLGRGAAEELLAAGNEVLVHARNRDRAAAVDDLAERGARLVTGDLASRADTCSLAEQVNAIGQVDSVIHNAGIYVDHARVATPEGHARTLAVNVLAPYLLTACIPNASRLIYLSSDMHTSGDTSLRDIDWAARRWNGVQAYCDSKLYVTAFAFALARRRPRSCVHAVDPGWVPTRMGGPGAPDNLELGHRTQAWLAVTDDPDAIAAGYWHHQRRHKPTSAALDPLFQDALLDELARLTDVPLP